MGLVDYSDSESDSEAPTKPISKPSTDGSSSKKPSSIARTATGRILVSLPTTSASDSAAAQGSEPPAKRARLGASAGSSRFSNFGSFLPPPKVAKPAASQAAKGNAPRPGIHLKTGAEPAFSRETDGFDGDYEGVGGGSGSGLNLPAPKASTGPTIPEGQKPEEEVKLVGKPLMFKPLSVSRKPAKKKRIVPGAVPKQPAEAEQNGTMTAVAINAPTEVPKKKISLFSMEDDAPAATLEPERSGAYEPLFGGVTAEEETEVTEPYPSSGQAALSDQQQASYPSHPTPQSLSTIADDLNLSKKARRELFGRGGPAGGGAKIVNFNMEREYSHNEAVRASGEQQAYNPVRAIAPGKHNLRQLVNAAQNNRTALEDSFAASQSSKREAGSRYGWG